MFKTMDEETLIGHVADRLARKYPTLSSAVVSEVVRDLYSTFDGARVRDFVPLIVERRARTALDQLTVSYEQEPEDRPTEQTAS
jgi:hypothetical protein